MVKFHRDYDLLLEPTTASVAPRIQDIRESEALKERMRHAETLSLAEMEDLASEMFRVGQTNTPFNWLYNLTGQPSISLPLGQGEGHLPLGLQLTAPKGREDWLLALGHYLEDHQQFYQPLPSES